MWPPEIPVEKVREAFERSGLSKCELARRMGWMKVVPNIHRVSQALGQERDSTGKKRQRLTYALAARLVEAMGVSPFDVGI